MAEAPYRVQVVSCSPNPRKSTVSGPGRKHAVVGEPTEFVIQGRDQYGNR